MHDLACVVHLHSLYSDGTGTVREIARAARRAGADVVLLTDHDTLEAKDRGEEGWYRDGVRAHSAERSARGKAVLVLVGTEVSPRARNHYLAFGIDRAIDHDGLDAAGICRAVSEAGGFGFAAHPFSLGSERFRDRAPGMPFDDLECEALHGVELWSFVNDTGEAAGSLLDMLRFVATPARALDHPPERNLRIWDELCRTRRVVGIGGLDAHQFGKRVGPVVPIRVMAYRRSFRFIRTHVLCEEAPTRVLEHDREQVYDALRAGRCYIAVDSVAPARGFRFEADDLPMGAEAPAGPHRTLRARVPLPARLRLLRDGVEVAEAAGETLEHEVEEPGVYRVEAHRRAKGRERTWILSNPIYLREDRKPDAAR
jgi:PHP domain